MGKEEKDIELEGESCPAQEEKPDYYEQLIRLKAEFDNYRKRTERERSQLVAFGAEQVLLSFLPLYDAMVKAEGEIKKTGHGDAKYLQHGLDIIFKEMKKVFSDNGVIPMESLGKPYNAMEQEVLTMLPCNGEKDGFVVEEVQKGFKVGDRVLRHAKVCVGKAPEESAEKNAEEEIADKKENSAKKK
ncbi:Molecular chaperone GrpE (heat shock protein) [Elusimicrobium minutum Pei191]|uniref:Protein GrpE n=1 Tax=Elusimicrobium minutum (strain Pei191) TaxID=445932 RepID=B2KAX1_ELUMP|nr:nucleotide exchange factor GrpE [Elusimicrobium minutum]ACC97667.1 Molecular chaperone GrpE (heat shock protein) [Elusimicrobium minutum Pei191]